MDVTTFLQFFINGIVLGAIYVLLAIGLSIIFGMIGIVNLTHGILYMLGAYATVTLAPYIGFFPSLIISPLLVALFGMAIEAAFLRRIYKGDPALGLLFTFGLAMFLEQAVRFIWGTQGIPFQIPDALRGAISMGPIIYSKYRYFIGLCSILVIAGLWFFLEKTRYGTIIRAGSRDPDMVPCWVLTKPVFCRVRPWRRHGAIWSCWPPPGGSSRRWGLTRAPSPSWSWSKAARAASWVRSSPA
jgi:branched-chain amino acid transport system permease protein